MPDIQIIPGKKYRIVETYDDGTIATFQGLVVKLESNGKMARLGKDEAIVAYVQDQPGVKVSITRIPDPLPTKNGSVISVQGMRVSGAPITFVLIGGSWIDEDGTHEPAGGLMKHEWEVIYEPKAAR